MLLITYNLLLCACGGGTQCTCGGQRTTLWRWLFLSTFPWFPGIEPWLPESWQVPLPATVPPRAYLYYYIMNLPGKVRRGLICSHNVFFKVTGTRFWNWHFFLDLLPIWEWFFYVLTFNLNKVSILWNPGENLHVLKMWTCWNWAILHLCGWHIRTAYCDPHWKHL